VLEFSLLKLHCSLDVRPTNGDGDGDADMTFDCPTQQGGYNSSTQASLLSPSSGLGEIISSCVSSLEVDIFPRSERIPYPPLRGRQPLNYNHGNIMQ
jgi:hypothetical protein